MSSGTMSGTQSRRHSAHPKRGSAAGLAGRRGGDDAGLARRFPGVPNIGDITKYDWTALQGQVDIITAGFPCQDISNAGKRVGIEGSRSGIWTNVSEAVRILRPKLVFLENVSAIRGRGLSRVLGDLAESGYDAQWTCYRASGAGAPHHRDRWFCVAAPTDPDRG
ncbi:DNA cytosine methyltransferase [Streptomyces sp. NPDC056159]|uniref:DNA cytosine methyltransferase n=1 Tax=Streptomyces sp. NPDC056159 TaxID=3155537 RepID=UPI003415184A